MNKAELDPVGFPLRPIPVSELYSIKRWQGKETWNSKDEWYKSWLNFVTECVCLNCSYGNVFPVAFVMPFSRCFGGNYIWNKTDKSNLSSPSSFPLSFPLPSPFFFSLSPTPSPCPRPLFLSFLPLCPCLFPSNSYSLLILLLLFRPPPCPAHD